MTRAQALPLADALLTPPELWAPVMGHHSYAYFPPSPPALLCLRVLGPNSSERQGWEEEVEEERKSKNVSNFFKKLQEGRDRDGIVSCTFRFNSGFLIK